MAQVWPYVQLCKEDPALRKMIAGVIRRQLKLINIDQIDGSGSIEALYRELDRKVAERMSAFDGKE